MTTNWHIQQQKLPICHQLGNDVCFALVDSCYIGEQTYGMHASLENKLKNKKFVAHGGYHKIASYSQCVACSVESKLLLVLENVIPLYLWSADTDSARG